MNTQTKQLTNQPIAKLFTHMSLPIIMSLLISGSYNLADAFFVTQGVGVLAFGGVSVVFPLLLYVHSVSLLIGTGAASIISRCLGAKDNSAAEVVASNAIAMSIIFSLTSSIIGVVYLRSILQLMGVSDELLPYAYDYVLPQTIFTTILMLSVVLLELL